MTNPSPCYLASFWEGFPQSCLILHVHKLRMVGSFVVPFVVHFKGMIDVPFTVHFKGTIVVPFVVHFKGMIDVPFVVHFKGMIVVPFGNIVIFSTFMGLFLFFFFLLLGE